MSGGWTDGEEAIVYERCTACGAMSYFVRGFCPACGDPEVEVLRSSGRGTIHAVTQVMRAPTVELRTLAPYAILLVDMEEGFRMMAHGEPDLAIGDAVTASFRSFGGRLVPHFERSG